jgi:hypothetical protein
MPEAVATLTDIKTLLADLQGLVKYLRTDLLERVTEVSEVDRGLRDAYAATRQGHRTAQAFEVWRDDYLTQVAVAWVLACVFVRYLEDNALIDESWLAGTDDRMRQAMDAHEAYFRTHPHDSDRDYFLYVFRQMCELPAVRELYAEGHTPLWALGPSGDGSMRLLAFWREIVPETGALRRSFRVGAGDTRFLGDLYQDLSEEARKKYALLQTPVFVEEFLLDHTLTPALDEFGLEHVRLIDPACGSGHFLLGAFRRLFDLWAQREPGTNPRVLAQRALDAIAGVDLNPFAVAIARFRLIVAALHACGIQRLKDAPGWTINVAAGDSLLYGDRWTRTGERVAHQPWLSTEESWAPPIYALEQPQELQRILGQQYHIVVGNPPYITVKDVELNAAYRERYDTCHRQYSLAVPFIERFFDLAQAAQNGRGAGYVGMITANSFMKREFGKKLIEKFFPRVDLTHVIDTSGAYIPGHGTPTVILFGRNRNPVGDEVRAVLGIRGEPGTPEEPAQGMVWQSIVAHLNQSGSQNEFITVTNIARETFAKHPWSLGGGGQLELTEIIEQNSACCLQDKIEAISSLCITREDEAYLLPQQVLTRIHIRKEHQIISVQGDQVRDWQLNAPGWTLFPYDANLHPVSFEAGPEVHRFLWPMRELLWRRRELGGDHRELGRTWWEWNRFLTHRFRQPLSIAFAFVATHNHFVLDRGGKVFNRSAPVIKLPSGATEDDHLALLGLLNSSIACFCMKQVFHNKGSTVDERGARQRTMPFEDFYEHTGTGLSKFPIPEQKPISLPRLLDRMAREYGESLPDAVIRAGMPMAEVLAEARSRAESIRRNMIAAQEELDWQCYHLYSLADEDLQYNGTPPPLKLGERAFEIVMARKMAAGELETAWFTRHSSTPITALPNDWPHDYRQIVERRIALIESDPNIALIEQPEYKRRWNTEPWDQQLQRALRTWLLDRLESTHYWPDPAQTPELTSCTRLAERAARDTDFLQVAALYRGREDFDVLALVSELVASEAVPFLPVLRYKPSGLTKRAVWECTWELQRREDAGEAVGPIPVPPKYAAADFKSADIWRLRGKLDVPKERFISYPSAERDSDRALVVGWAGWNHLQQAMALAAYYDRMKHQEGWAPARLVPLLAGLDQLVPWLLQWHNDVDPDLQLRLGEFYRDFVRDEAQSLGHTVEQLRTWQPPQATRSRRRQ